MRVDVFDTTNEKYINHLFLHKVENKNKANRSLRYLGELQIDQAGIYDLHLNSHSGYIFTKKINVMSQNNEMLDVRSDIDSMLNLAQISGGELIDLKELPSVIEHIPSKAKIIPNDQSESLLHSPGLFGLAIFVLAIEWIGRKLMHLA